MTEESEDMVWVRFLKAYTHKPTLQVTIDYPADTYANVPTAIANAAIDAEAAVKENPPEAKPSAAVKARQKAPDV